MVLVRSVTAEHVGSDATTEPGVEHDAADAAFLSLSAPYFFNLSFQVSLRAISYFHR
jgi:hypothetical protein